MNVEANDTVGEHVYCRRHVRADDLAVGHDRLNIECVRVDLDELPGIGRENRLERALRPVTFASPVLSRLCKPGSVEEGE